MAGSHQRLLFVILYQKAWFEAIHYPASFNFRNKQYCLKLYYTETSTYEVTPTSAQNILIL